MLAEVIDLSPDDFVQMLLLGGCFIIELIRKYGLHEFRERDAIIFQHGHLLNQLMLDSMLVENQVPFFVLDQLFSMTKMGNPNDDFLPLIHPFADVFYPWPEASEVSREILLDNIEHFFGLMHKIWCSSFAMMIADKPVRKEEWEMTAINSASELKEAGVKFEGDTESNFLDIKFIKRVMKVPGFDVSDSTESILRNLITYEHFFVDDHPRYVTDYAYFLDCLINSPEDAEILRPHVIFANLLGDDEMVYHMC